MFVNELPVQELCTRRGRRRCAPETIGRDPTCFDASVFAFAFHALLMLTQAPGPATTPAKQYPHQRCQQQEPGPATTARGFTLCPSEKLGTEEEERRERHWVPCWAGLFVYDYAVCRGRRQARTRPGQGPEGKGGGHSAPMPLRFRNSSSMSRPARAESILVSAVVINALWAPPLADLANRAGSLPMRNQQQLQSGRARPWRTWVVSRYRDRRSYLIGPPRRTQGLPAFPGRQGAKLQAQQNTT